MGRDPPCVVRCLRLRRPYVARGHGRHALAVQPEAEVLKLHAAEKQGTTLSWGGRGATDQTDGGSRLKPDDDTHPHVAFPRCGQSERGEGGDGGERRRATRVE